MFDGTVRDSLLGSDGHSGFFDCRAASIVGFSDDSGI